MSLTVTITFLLAGAFITALAFYKDWKSTPNWNNYKTALTIGFIVFIVGGIWDAFNKSIDSKNDKKETNNSIRTDGKVTRLKVDTVGKTVLKSADKTDRKLDTGFNSLKKTKIIYSAILALSATPDGKNPIITKAKNKDSLGIRFLFTNYGKGTAFNIKGIGFCIFEHNGNFIMQHNTPPHGGNKSLAWLPNQNLIYTISVDITHSELEDSIFYCLKINFTDSTKVRKAYPQILFLDKKLLEFRSIPDEDYNKIEAFKKE